MDITYIPMARGFVYLAVVLDWAARRVFSCGCRSGWRRHSTSRRWRILWRKHGTPELFNTDQGSQFTGTAFAGALASNGITISTEGKGAWPRRDNVFVERLWRSIKYKEAYLSAYDTVSDARASIGRYSTFTIADVHTRALTAAHRIKPTSTSGHCWQAPWSSSLNTRDCRGGASALERKWRLSSPGPRICGAFRRSMANTSLAWRTCSTNADAPDPKRPVVCFDEGPVQLIGEVRELILARPGRVGRYDYKRCTSSRQRGYRKGRSASHLLAALGIGPVSRSL